MHRHVFGEDGDAPLAFLVVVVENQLSRRFLIGSELLALQNHLVYKGRLSMVDMGDNSNVSKFSHLYFSILSPQNYKILSVFPLFAFGDLFLGMNFNTRAIAGSNWQCV